MPNYKVVDADVLDADLQTVADAIKAKAGTEEALEFPSGFANAVESIETGGGGDTSLLGAILDGSLTEISNDTITTIHTRVLSERDALAKVSFPSVTEIKDHALYKCPNLVSVYCPKVTKLETSAFQYMGSYSQWKQVDFPLLSSMGDNALSGHAFETVNFPNLTSVSKGGLSSCKKLKTAILPKIQQLPQAFFSGCSSLTLVDVTAATRINSNCFYGCASLKTLIFRNTSLVGLSGSGAFDGTPFASGGTGGVAIVPTALIEAYQTATNWSTMYAAGTCTFLPLEEYTLDGTTTGEIDMAKVEAKLNELYGGATA